MTGLSVPLSFTALEAVPRRGEPVTVGLPWPRGALADETHFALIAPEGARQPLQSQVLSRWPDGSIRWCLFDFLAIWNGTDAESGYRIAIDKNAIGSETPVPAGPSPTLRLQINGQPPLTAFIAINDHGSIAGQIRSRFNIASIESHNLIIHGWFDCFRGSDAARFHLCVTNRNAADHPGGNWDLGNAGSIDIRELAINIPIAHHGIRCSNERGQSFHDVDTYHLLQASSGGENWQSLNHLTKNKTVDLSFLGYEQGTTKGLRATPIVAVGDVAVAMPQFWENFPKAITVDEGAIRLSLFPKQNEPHELQGGEQKTHCFTVAFAKDAITDDPLVWARSPIIASAPPEWYAASGVIYYLTPKAGDPHTAYLNLVDQAIEGADTFIHKREKIDEYGWRHFGDIWGDHEAVYAPGPEPMISHYNNQYDCIAGFIAQYFRSGDTRWLRQGLECADHTCDIDVYHTESDKAAYNGGLFWHTYHYAAADTGTHRSYPKSLRTAQHFDSGQDLGAMGQTGAALKKNYAIGGGPSAAHNYNAGLMLAYYLTGNPLYRDSAVGLAEFVLNMDDGRKTIFRWLSTRDTGLSMQSSAGYLGPGRASANSLLAVLTGHELTGDAKFLAKAEQIIRRVVHPKQNLEKLDLLNAELRWFYTMFLQALGRYLDDKIELAQLDENYAYARLSLLHYARYMAEHEKPILSQPEKLQYPNETWAAQDLRKVEVFQYAAKHACGTERERFLERAEWFFHYCVETLNTFTTKSLCRPMILCMNFGWSRAWWKQNPDAIAPVPIVNVNADSFGEWAMYVPQKEVAIKRAKTIIIVGTIVGVSIITELIIWLVKSLL